MDQTPERISEVVSTLVESLSQMVSHHSTSPVIKKVMSCIQGDIQEGLREHCSQLINSTNQLITIAKMTAADDPSLLTPVTDSIKAGLCDVGYSHLNRTPAVA